MKPRKTIRFFGFLLHLACPFIKIFFFLFLSISSFPSTIHITPAYRMYLLAQTNKSAKDADWSRARNSYNGINLVPWSIMTTITSTCKSCIPKVVFLKQSTYCRILSIYVVSFFLWLLMIKALINSFLNCSKEEIDFMWEHGYYTTWKHSYLGYYTTWEHG